MACAAPTASSSKETTNYARLCRLLVDVGTQALRDTLDVVHPPPTLQTVLAGNKTTLQSLRTRKIINPTQWGKLFPAIPNSVSSRDFDITLLMVLLRNMCGLPSPATGWDRLPAVTDISREADIARVKYFRNTVYAHAQHASVDDATFKTYWQDIRDTLVRLGGVKYKAAINNLETECMDPDIEDHYKELLNQWKNDEDNVKDQLKQIMRKLDDLKAAFDPSENSTVGEAMESPNDISSSKYESLHDVGHPSTSLGYSTSSEGKRLSSSYTSLSLLRKDNDISKDLEHGVGHRSRTHQDYSADAKMRPLRANADNQDSSLCQQDKTFSGRKKRPISYHGAMGYANDIASSKDGSLREVDDHSTSSSSFSTSSQSLTTTLYHSASTASRSISKPFLPTSIRDITVGMTVLVSRCRGDTGRGIVKYLGPLPGRKDIYVGIELAPGQAGKHDGSVNGERFFYCEPNQGIFTSFNKVIMCYAE